MAPNVRGLVPRPLRITVETTALDDTTVTTRPQAMACTRAHRGGDGLPRYRRMVTCGGKRPAASVSVAGTGRRRVHG
ncbi:hypothetical protein AB0I94_32465 [Streptomyces sp. NPDC050147]|uniref:hypothetical protein n=1 Tax=Streptomyces sp. NPDC050147 TaxID=3155513 RepID=UPI003432AB70